MSNAQISLKDIELIRGMEPNREQGGRLVDGVIIGPKHMVNRWRIKDEATLYENRGDAETEVKRRMLHLELFEAMGFGRNRPRELTPQEVVRLVQCHGKRIKEVLQTPRYAKFIGN